VHIINSYEYKSILLLQVEQWRGRCPATGHRMIGHEPLELIRWHADRPLAPNNCVLLASVFVKRMDAEGRAAVVTPEVSHNMHEDIGYMLQAYMICSECGMISPISDDSAQ
jgi:hypothetical protein